MGIPTSLALHCSSTAGRASKGNTCRAVWPVAHTETSSRCISGKVGQYCLDITSLSVPFTVVLVTRLQTKPSQFVSEQISGLKILFVHTSLCSHTTLKTYLCFEAQSSEKISLCTHAALMHSCAAGNLCKPCKPVLRLQVFTSSCSDFRSLHALSLSPTSHSLCCKKWVGQLAFVWRLKLFKVSPHEYTQTGMLKLIRRLFIQGH